MPVIPNIHPADVVEEVDNGRRLALVERYPDLGAVQEMRLEMGTTRPELALEGLEDIRTELRELMKVVDTSEHRDLHVALGEHLIRHDALIAIVRERLS